MAVNEIFELSNYDDIKRILNRKELQEYETYKEYFNEIDNMFDTVKEQIFQGMYLGSSKFIPYEYLYYNEYINQNFPQVLTYYKNKFFQLIKNDILSYLDLYIVGNFEGLEDGAHIETSRIFDALYNLIYGQNFEYFYTMYFDSIYTLLSVDDYTMAINQFQKYFNEIIDQNVNVLKKLIDISNKKEKKNFELFKLYLSLKGIDIESIKEILNQLDSKTLSEFELWLNSLINSIKQTIIYQTRARDSIITTLNNPDKRSYVKDLLDLMIQS